MLRLKIMARNAGLDQGIAEEVVKNIWILDIFLRKNLEELFLFFN